jgi:hypothetical protein
MFLEYLGERTQTPKYLMYYFRMDISTRSERILKHILDPNPPKSLDFDLPLHI